MTNIPTPYRLHCFRALNAALLERGWGFEVFFMAETEAGRHWRFDADAFGFPHRFLYGKNPSVGGAILHINPSIIRDLRAQPADVLLMAGGWALPTNMLITLAPGLARHPRLIFWSESHLRSIRHSGRMIDWLRQKLLRRYDGFAVPGRLALDYVKRYAPHRPVYPFPNTVNESVFRDAVYRLRQHREAWRDSLQVPKGRRILLISARLAQEKGIHEFLSALSGLPETVKQTTTLLIAGDGPLKEQVRRQIAHRGSVDVRLMGHLEESEMVKHYAIADGFALPSLHDPNPLSVVEALWAGLPLLLSDRVGNHPESLRAGNNGWLFDAHSSRSIGEAFLQWCTASPQALASCGEISLSIAEGHFETRQVVRTFLDSLLEGIVETCTPIAIREAQA